MKTQLQSAIDGEITTQMRQVSEKEGIDIKLLREKIADGRIVIPCSLIRKVNNICGVGEGLKTKVNANIGTSKDNIDLDSELKKLELCIKRGADTVMDLSTGGDLVKIRRTILKHSSIPLGTVPLYEVVVKKISQGGSITDITIDDILEVVESQAKDGVDFMTLHCGVTFDSLKYLGEKKRTAGVVSRGGAFIVDWMIKNDKENPFYERYDDLLKIAVKYDVTLSLGDGMRPGALADSTDAAQLQELTILGQLARRARKQGVQVMIEGPGHIPLNHIQMNIKLEKQLCDGAPFYVLGPLVTDIAPGYDHITSAIGGALAASYGADFLCYVTSSEHLRLPTVQDVEEGVISAKIAAHAADIAKGIKGVIDWDRSMAEARRKRDWNKQIELSINPERARELREAAKPLTEDVCTMCSDFCSMKVMEKCKL